MPPSGSAVVLKLFELFDAGASDRLEEVLAPEFVAHVPGSREPLDLEAYRQFCTAVKAAFPDAHHEFSQVLVDGEHVVTVGTMSGTHQGTFGDLPATGRAVTLDVIHVDRVVNGRLVAHRGITDLGDLRAQLTEGKEAAVSSDRP